MLRICGPEANFISTVPTLQWISETSEGLTKASPWDPRRISDASVLSWDWPLAFPTSSQVLILLLVVQMWWVKNHWFTYKFHCPWMIWSFLMIYDLSKAHDCQIQLFHQQFLHRLKYSSWINFLLYPKGVTSIVYPQLKQTFSLKTSFLACSLPCFPLQLLPKTGVWKTFLRSLWGHITLSPCSLLVQCTYVLSSLTQFNFKHSPISPLSQSVQSPSRVWPFVTP